MFTPRARTFSCLTGILLLITGIEVFSQEGDVNLQRLQTEAMNDLKAGDFRAALPLFRKLMNVEPDNAMHPYHVGRCLVELNEDLEDAIEILYGASKKEVPADVNYYLGKAYHRNYNFADARKYYGRFELEASRQEAKQYKVDHLMETTLSAAEITSMYNPFEVVNVTFIDLTDSLQFSQIKMKGGQMQRKPGAYFHPDEDPKGLTSLAFVPRNPVRGDYIYFAGYERNQKEGSQLFRVKKGTGNSWSDPEELNALNSGGDEVLPYFDPIENDLYFASNGRLGVGGFDLYRTHYDQERDQWSDPVNLGFPVNSAMDEYLLLPGSDLGMLMFFSTRQGTDSTLTVYRVHLIEPKKKTEPTDYKMLAEIANLEGAASDILAEMEEMKELENKVVATESISIEQSKAKPTLTKVTVLSEERIRYDFQKNTLQAMRHQNASDSLHNLARNARYLVADSDDPNDRWVWQKQIMLWDKKARDEEKKAAELFAKLELEQAELRKLSSETIPDAIEIDTVMGDLTLYRYTENDSPNSARPSSRAASFRSESYTGSPPASPAPTPQGEMSHPQASPILIGFEIMEDSPYSENNPIPIDPPLPSGVFYMIQIGVFGTPVEPDAFQGLSPITGLHVKERASLKYFSGKFKKYEDASAALRKVKSLGFEDAFVVAWLNGAIVSIQQAKELE